MAYDKDTAERVRRIFAGRDDVVEKAMMGGLCFMVGDAMCCSVSGRGGLLIRVGPEAQERMLREPHAAPMKMGRRTISGFVHIGPEGYRTDAALKAWVNRGLEFVATLPKEQHGRRGRHAR